MYLKVAELNTNKSFIWVA